MRNSPNAPVGTAGARQTQRLATPLHCLRQPQHHKPVGPNPQAGTLLTLLRGPLVILQTPLDKHIPPLAEIPLGDFGVLAPDRQIDEAGRLLDLARLPVTEPFGDGQPQVDHLRTGRSDHPHDRIARQVAGQNDFIE